VKPYLPPESSRFKVLLTTREELGQPLEHLRLNELQPEAALDLLKSLIGSERIQQESEIAEQLCQWLGCLPLGLELVGHYLGRDPDFLLEAMLSLLEKKRLGHRSVLEADSTMTARLGLVDALELSWERLKKDVQQLSCLLSLFALADIPWDLVRLVSSNLLSIDLDNLEEARGDLLCFNLLQRTGEETYCLHQLIREFLHEKLEQSTQADAQKQAFCQTMVKVAEQIPDLPTRQMVESVTAAIPHVAEAVTALTDYLSDEDLMKSFVGLGRFYEGQGFYDLAEPWYEQCLSVSQTRLSADPRRTATSLINLAHLYASQGRYSEAEALFLQGLKLSQTLGDNYSVARSLNNLASLYQAQARYNEAEPLSLQALKLSQQLGDNYSVAQSLNNLASLYQAQARYNEAERLYRQALEIYHRTVGDDHPYMAQSLNNLASLYQALERYNEAEHLYRQALEIYKRVLGADHPGSVTIRNNIEKLCSNRTAVELP
jgi:tetratricopeptide (TPR) repeat protein